MDSVIYKESGFFWFVDGKGDKYKYASEEEALANGGKKEKVAVSGVPYKVDSTSVDLGTDNE